MLQSRYSHFAVTLLLVAGCASATGEKGGLVAMSVKSDALDRAHAGRRLALVIGIPDFQDSEWRPLRYAAKDARDVAALFADPKRGNFTKVLTRTTPEEATLAELDRAFEALARENRGADDTVVVYVSSHGTLARDGRGELRRYLVASDTRMADVPRTGFSMDALKERFDRLPSKKKLLVLATCHSGTGKSLLPADVQKELAGIKAGFFVRPLEESSKASIILSACDWGETAREDERLANDIYTHFFVQALVEMADRNGDGAVTATEAHDYARRRTFEFTGGKQRPSAESLMVGADPVVLAGSFSQKGSPELYSYASSLDGFSVRVDGETLGELPGGMALKEGAHQVQISKGGGPSLFEGKVTVDAGERIAIEDLVVQEAPQNTVAVRMGVQQFLDAAVRNEVTGATPALSISIARRDLPLPRLSLAVDGSLARGDRSFSPVAGAPAVPYRFVAVSLGVSTPYTWHKGPFSLGIGPRIAAIYMQKVFTQSELAPTQDFFTLSPGVALSAGWSLSERVELGVAANLHDVVMKVDAKTRSLGFAEVWAGLGVRL